MRTVIQSFVIVCWMLASTITAWCGQPLSTFNGNWINENSNTRSLVNLQISVSGSNIDVQAFGSCHPTPCDWGKQPGIAFAKDVSTNVVSNTERIMALYNPDFSKNTLVIEPINANRIKVTLFTQFTDNSGRSNYTIMETFKKAALILPAPELISPVCGKVFNHYPRTTTLSWKNVPGAASYTVEIDCFHCCTSGKWCTEVGKTWKVVPKLKTNNYTFDFVGAQPGRWRVWAVDSKNKEGKKSAWCEFKYTR